MEKTPVSKIRLLRTLGYSSGQNNAKLSFPIVIVNGIILTKQLNSVKDLTPYLNMVKIPAPPMKDHHNSSIHQRMAYVYGESSCGDCHELLSSLKKHHVSYKYFDININQASKANWKPCGECALRFLNGGKKIIHFLRY